MHVTMYQMVKMDAAVLGSRTIRSSVASMQASSRINSKNAWAKACRGLSLVASMSLSRAGYPGVASAQEHPPSAMAVGGVAQR